DPQAAASLASALVAQEPALLAAPVALLFGFPLVVQLLAARHGDLDLGAAAVVEIDFQRHNRHALALDRLRQFGDLARLEEQFAGPARLVIEAVGLQIFGDVGVDEKNLALAVDADVALGNGRPAAA